ncbi:MAG: alkaline phosphatase family protein [Planctomycetes bacterium]|nr:alkaline phosphatase family protein [Planctomycetota bacterium]
MRLFPSTVIVASLIFLAAAPPAQAKDAPKTKKVLIFGLDGTRLDALKTAKTPNLHQLIAEGGLVETQILGQRYRKNDTISGPGWSSNLTGVWADKHGVQNNNVGVNKLQDYPHFFKRLKEVRPDAFTTSAASWSPIPQFIVSGANINKDCSHTGAKDYQLLDTVVEAEAVGVLTTTNPTAMFVYFGSIDHAGHTFGFHPSVKEYAQQIEHVDARLGKVLAALKARPTYAKEDWLILVTTDHGGQGKTHSNGQKIPEILTGFIIVSGTAASREQLPAKAEIVDVVPTALAHLGVPIKKEWGLDGRAIGLKQSSPEAPATK